MSSLALRAVRTVVTVAVGASTLALGPVAFASDKVPYNDPTASGTITLCDSDLRPVTSGSVDDLPFVWRAVGSQTAPAPYNDTNRAATLYYYQPRQGIPPGGWTGSKMNGTATYTNPDHPMSQSTVLDHPLKDFLKNYPPQWNGFVQLRLIYSTFGQAPSPTYATVDLQVNGESWTAVNAGSSPCDAGSAISSEVGSVPNFEKSAKAVEAQIAKQDAKHSASSTPSASPSGSPSAERTAEGSGTPSASPTGTTAASATNTSRSNAPLVVVGLVVIAVLVAGIFFWRSRRRPSR